MKRHLPCRLCIGGIPSSRPALLSQDLGKAEILQSPEAGRRLGRSLSGFLAGVALEKQNSRGVGP